MNPAQLARRLEAVADGGNRVEQYLWWQLARSKREQLASRRRAGESEERSGTPGPSTTRDRTWPASLGQAFDSALQRVDELLFEPYFQERAAAPAEVINEAIALEEFCYTRARDASNMADAVVSGRRVTKPLRERQKYLRGGRPLEKPAAR